MFKPQPAETDDMQPEATHRRTRWLAILLLIVFVCGLLATPLALLYNQYARRTQPATEPRTDEPSQLDRIAYITLDHQLATISPDGSDLRRLTDLNSRFQFPAWSPDGRHVAVVGGDSLFAVPDVDGAAASGSMQRLYQNGNEPPFYLYWSPDSQMISFLASHPSGIALHLARLSEQSESRLLATGQPFYWAWTPTGDQILMHSGFSGRRARLALLDPLTGGPGASIAEPGFFQAPGMSASGAYRAFAEVDADGSSQLVIEDTDGQSVHSEPHLGQVALSWSPVDDLLAFTSPAVDSAAFYGPLRVLEPLSGDVRMITPDNVLAYFWSPDGRFIAFFTVPSLDDGGVQAANDPVERKRLSKIRLQHEEIRLDLWVADVATGDRRRLSTFVPSELFFGQFLPFFDQYALSHRLWSPKADALVLPMIQNEVSSIFIVPIDGREPRLLVEGAIGFWSHQ